MKYDFDEIIDRKGTNSIKLEEGRSIEPLLPDDYLPLWVADMDFACPSPIIDAMKARLDRRILGYSHIYDPAFYAAVTGWMKRRHGWEVDPSTISYSSGVVSALNALVQILTAPDDEVLFQTPAYNPFNAAVARYGRKPIYNTLAYNDGAWSIDFDDFEAKVSRPECKLFILCSPQNPVGRVWSEDELRRLGKLCLDNGVFIVSDEIHADLIRKSSRHIPIAKLFSNDERIVTCTSPSKTFNIAGNQLSNIIIPDGELRQKFEEQPVTGMPGPLAVDATIAAYDKCEDWLEALKEYIDGNFALTADILDQRLPQAGYTPPEGTYLAWVDLSKCGLDDAGLRERIAKAGVFIEYHDSFVRDANGFVRINLACPRSVVKEALTRICDCLK